MRPMLSAVLAGSVLVPGGGVAVAEPTGLGWRPCVAVAAGWDPEDQRTECVVVRVPLDHANPGGRTTEIAVSRLKATGERTGVVVVNPGGPGRQGVTMPESLTHGKAAGLDVHHDLVGFDPRGIGCSTAVPCERDTTEPDPALPAKDRARFEAGRDARRNRACFGRDPDLVRSMTTANVARDMDVIRRALGEAKIGYSLRGDPDRGRALAAGPAGRTDRAPAHRTGRQRGRR